MTYKLYLDDVRDPYPGWYLARSVDAAKKLIQTKGFPEVVSFDHDLGIVGSKTKSGIWTASEVEAPNGYDFAKWLIDQDMETPWMIEVGFRFYVHSANPVGAENIRGLLHNYLNYLGKR